MTSDERCKIASKLMAMYPGRLSRAEWMEVMPLWEAMYNDKPYNDVISAVEQYGVKNRYYMPVPVQVLPMIGGR